LDIFLNQQPFHRDISILQAKALGPAIYLHFSNKFTISALGPAIYHISQQTALGPAKDSFIIYFY
jgi:hypothetical protein